MVARSPFILTALLALCAFAQDEDPVPDCNAPPTPVAKVINFSPFFITGGPSAPRPLTNPFSLANTRNNALGYVFAPRDVTVRSLPDPLKSFSERFLLPNENNWEIVNCTYSNIPGACINDQLALHLPKGGPGTIGAKTPIVARGARSPWAVYDLLGFRVTPDVDTTGVNVVVDVQAWGTDGKRLGGLRNVVKGAALGFGHNITLRDGGFEAVMQWMLEVKLDTGERLGYYLDDLAIVEQVYQADCPRERTISFGPTPSSNTTLKFDTLALGVPVQKKYRGIEFGDGWTTVPAGGENGRGVAIGGNGNDTLPSIYGADHALFDLARYRIRPDLSTVPADAVLRAEHFMTTVQGSQVCGTGGLGGAQARPRRWVWLESLEWQTIDIAATGGIGQSYGGFNKVQQIEWGLRYYPDPEQYPWIEVGFIVDEIEVRVWPVGNGKGFRQGCYRCLKYLAGSCEWPLIERGADNIWS